MTGLLLREYGIWKRHGVAPGTGATAAWVVVPVTVTALDAVTGHLEINSYKPLVDAKLAGHAIDRAEVVGAALLLTNWSAAPQSWSFATGALSCVALTVEKTSRDEMLVFDLSSHSLV